MPKWFVPPIAAVMCSLLVVGCLEQFVPANTKLHDHTLTAHIPGMSGDERIVYTRCYSRSDNGTLCPRARVVFNLPWPIPDLRWGND